MSFNTITDILKPDTIDINKYPPKPNIWLNEDNINEIFDWISGYDDGITPTFSTDFITELETIYNNPLPSLLKKILEDYNGYTPTRLIDNKYHPLNNIQDKWALAGFLSFADNCDQNIINNYLAPRSFIKNDYLNCLDITKLIDDNTIPFGTSYDGSIWCLNVNGVYYIHVRTNEIERIPLADTFDDFMKILRYSNRWWYK